MSTQTEKTIHALLSGRHPNVRKYAGKQVFVVGKEILPVKKSKKSLEDFKALKKKYGTPPTLTFVPEPGVTYILNVK